MFWRKSEESLLRGLEDVNQKIAGNPLSDTTITQARELIEQFKSEGREDDTDLALARVMLHLVSDW